MASPPAEQEPTRQLNVRLPAGLLEWAQSHAKTVIRPRDKRFQNQGETSALLERLLQRERRQVQQRQQRRANGGQG